MSSTLPPPATGITGAPDEKTKYVVSQSGHAAHPNDILQSCRTLQSLVSKMQEDAERELRQLDERIKARDLAEKRRVAPGWLDGETRLLQPERKGGEDLLMDESDGGGGPAGQFAQMSLADRAGASEMAVDQGEQLDRAFGGLSVSR
jgi:hypothetical protein